MPARACSATRSPSGPASRWISGGSCRDTPGPGVAEPQVWKHVQGRCLRPLVGDPDLEVEVGGISLGVGRLDLPVAVLVEDSGVEELVLGLAAVPTAVLGDEVVVGEGALGVVVAPLQVGVAGSGIEIPPVLLGVLAVVALRTGEPEDPLLEDRVLAVPERQGEAEVLAQRGESGEPVLVPPVGPGPGVVVGEVAPGVTVLAVVLAHGAPAALGQVRAPGPPRAGLVEAGLGMTHRLHPSRFGSWFHSRAPCPRPRSAGGPPVGSCRPACREGSSLRHLGAGHGSGGCLLGLGARTCTAARGPASPARSASPRLRREFSTNASGTSVPARAVRPRCVLGLVVGVGRSVSPAGRGPAIPARSASPRLRREFSTNASGTSVPARAVLPRYEVGVRCWVRSVPAPGAGILGVLSRSADRSLKVRTPRSPPAGEAP